MPSVTEPLDRRTHPELLTSAPHALREGECPPAMFTISGAVAYSGFTRSRLYEEIGASRIEARKLGRRTLIVGDSLRAYLANLPRADIRVGTRKAA